MPLKTRGGRKGTGRRGRPKKYPRPGEGERQQLQQPFQPLHEDQRQHRENQQEYQHHQHPAQKQRPPSLSLNTSHHDANGHTAVRPREERSYKDYFPNLNLKEPLRIVRVSKSDRPPAQDLNVDTRTTTDINTATNGNDANNGIIVDSNAIGGSGSTPWSTTTAKVATADKDDDNDDDDDQNDSGKERQVPEVPPRESSEDSELSSMSLDESPAENGSTTTAAKLKVNKEEQDDNSSPSLFEPEDEKNDLPDEPANEGKSITSTDSVTSVDGMVTAEEGEGTEMDEEANNKSGSSSSEEVISSSSTPGGKNDVEEEEEEEDVQGPERNGDPLVDHQKEGDLYQALSTRPQQQPLETINDINMGVNLDALPKPSFRLVTEEPKQVSTSGDLQNESGEEVTTTSTALTTMEDEGASSQQQRFQRPENHYIRYIEPSEADLMDMVEYDMDEHDDAWLQMLNEERRKEDLGEVSGDLFEAVMDQLEKEWFDLIKNLPKQVAEEPSLPEDSACAICDDTECENSNAIVFCDGCNLAVHQDCYGIPYIPEGQWLCRKCLVSPENPVSCIFCPNEGGAFKQTNTNKWGHLLCAIWIPEVGLSNSVYMEPIDNIENIPKSRWKLTCYICRRRQGACIQCDSKHCFVAFHVTCARWARLCMRMKSHGSHYDGVVFKAYCDKHTPRDYAEQVNVEQTVATAQAFFSSSHRRSNKTNNNNNHRTPRHRYVDDEVMMNDSSSVAAIGDGDNNDHNGGDASDAEDGEDDGRKKKRKKHKKKRRMNNDNSAVAQMLPSSKAARAHQHHYSAGAPIAPEYIISKLENMKCVRQATNLRRKPQLIVSICRYWSLKRESRRGAPLLKRLHLEPWTASSSQHKQTEVEKAHRAAAMMNLRADLERVRMLSEQVQKREKQKLERIRKQKAYLEMILFPVEYITKPLVDQLIEADKKELFRFPVTPDVAPDYSEIIDTPMSFADILEKFSVHEYTSLDQVESDIMLIWKNCMTYNKPETLYYRTAERLEKVSLDLLAQARKDYEELEIKKETGILAIDIHPEIFTYNTVHVPSPEELAAERERLEAEEKAKAEEEERQRVAAKKAEARKQADAERRRVKAAQAEAKRQKRLEYAARRAQEKAAAEAKAVAEAEENEMKQEGGDQVVAVNDVNGTGAGDDSNHKVPENKDSRVATRSSKAASTAASAAAHEETKDNKSSSSKVLRRRTRSMGSDGLIAPTAQELERRTSSEARNLLWHSGHVTEEDRHIVRPDRKRKAPPGWLYVEGTDTGNSSSDTDESSPTPSPRKKPRSESRPSKPKPGPIIDIKPEMIVWARVKGFPPHPARIVHPEKEDIGKHVLTSKHSEQDVLVEFYEVPDHHKWGWVSRTDIYALGDPIHDTDMLLVARKKKNSRRIKESRAGYAYACKVLGLDPAPALTNSTGSRK